MINVDGLFEGGVQDFRIEYFVDCVLHTIDLGVLQRYNGAVIRQIIDVNAFQMEGPTMDDRNAASMLELRRRLKRWYDARRAADPFHQLTTVKK